MTAKKKAGRPKGAMNKRSAALRKAVQTGLQPLEYLLQIMNNEDNEQEVRVDAAHKAAPYCHARLQSVVVTEKPYEGDPNSISNAQLAGVIARGGCFDDVTETPSKGKLN